MTLKAAAMPEVTIGDLLAIKIKNAIYPDEPWVKVAFKIGYDMTAIKKLGRKYYPHMNEIELITTLSKYDEESIKEAYQLATEGKACEANLQGRTCATMAHCMEKVQQ
jgi:hypothetical protein